MLGGLHLHHLHKHLHNAQLIVFDYIIFASYTLYLVAYFGLSVTAPQYLAKLDYFLKLYVSVFLVVRFNPFRDNVPFTRLDKKIVFSAAMLLLTSTFLGTFWGKLGEFLGHFPA